MLSAETFKHAAVHRGQYRLLVRCALHVTAVHDAPRWFNSYVPRHQLEPQISFMSAGDRLSQCTATLIMSYLIQACSLKHSQKRLSLFYAGLRWVVC